MRRWLVVIALLFGFAGQGYVAAARAATPVPIERPLSAVRGGRLQRTEAWWQTS
jgi:hypothetical protein